MRRKIFTATENLGGLAEQIDKGASGQQDFTPAMAGVGKSALEKQIENQLPDSEKVDLSSTNASGGTTLESLGIDLSAGLSNAASAMVSSICSSDSSEGNEMDQTLFLQTEEMQPLTDMFFVLQKMHGNLMKGHVDIEDPEENQFIDRPGEYMVGYEEFGLLAQELSTITGSNAALEAHYSALPMSQKIKVAVEDIQAGKQGVLQKAFDILIKYLKRLLEWLIGPQKEKAAVAGKVAGGPMKKIMKFMGEAVTGRSFSSLDKEDREDLSKTITALPMNQQMWFFNGRHVDERLGVASNAAVHKLFTEGSLLQIIYSLEDVLETGKDAEAESAEILAKYDFLAESKALAAQDLNDVGSDVSIHDLRDIRKVYQILDHRADLISKMQFAIDTKLDEKIVVFQQKWLKELQSFNGKSASDIDVRRKIIRQRQIDVVSTFVKMQNKILDDVLNYHKAARAIVRWTAVTIDSKLKRADAESDRHALRQLKQDTTARLVELDALVK